MSVSWRQPTGTIMLLFTAAAAAAAADADDRGQRKPSVADDM
jgi:hypothetical protein